MLHDKATSLSTAAGSLILAILLGAPATASLAWGRQFRVLPPQPHRGKGPPVSWSGN